MKNFSFFLFLFVMIYFVWFFRVFFFLATRSTNRLLVKQSPGVLDVKINQEFTETTIT